MKFIKKIIFTKIDFGYINDGKILKGREEIAGKKTIERIRPGLKLKYGSIIIEPKIMYITKHFEFDLKDGKERK